MSRTGQVDVRTLVRGLGADMRRLLDRKFTVHVEVAEDCPGCAVEPESLMLALVDLVVHVRDAMSEGGTLTIGARPVQHTVTYAGGSGLPDPPDWLDVFVAHDGPAVAPASSGSARARRLCAAKDFIARCGGCLVVGSALQGGTVIAVRLPAQ